MASERSAAVENPLQVPLRIGHGAADRVAFRGLLQTPQLYTRALTPYEVQLLRGRTRGFAKWVRKRDHGQVKVRNAVFL